MDMDIQTIDESEQLPFDDVPRWTDAFIENSHPHSYVKAYLHYFCEALLHTHEFYEVNFVMHGSGKYYHDKICMNARVGDVFITPPNVYHGYLKKDDFYIYNLCIRKDFFDYYKKELFEIPAVAELFEGVPYLHRLKGKQFSFHLSNQALAMLKSDLDLIYECSQADSDSAELTKNIITLKILAHLAFIYSQQFAKWSKKNENNSFASIMESIHYMKDNLSEKVTIDMLSERAHMSRSSYIRHFKSIFNTSPMEYLRNLRVSRARAMLMKGNATKSYIAQECGFYDVAHMSKYI